jgi:hypothetical protein
MTAILLLATLAAGGAAELLTFPGGDGPGHGKHIVLVSGDEEYRSEEAMPQLAAILSERHGFRCTVLFALDPDGTVNPNRQDNIPGLELLKTADLMVLFTRFRDLPDEQMKHLADYLGSGKPLLGIRTATHAFQLKSSPTYRRFSWNSKEWEGGFGRQVLGETWVAHHGQHGKQSTRGILNPAERSHPILRGVGEHDIWGATDVYRIRDLPPGTRTLVHGQVLAGMSPDDLPAEGKQNDPMMPLAWVRTYAGMEGKSAHVFATTMGSSQELLNEGFRRLLVNAAYWSLGLEKNIRADAPVDIVGTYQPRPFGFNGFAKGLRPPDFNPLKEKR